LNFFALVNVVWVNAKMKTGSEQADLRERQL